MRETKALIRFKDKKEASENSKEAATSQCIPAKNKEAKAEEITTTKEATTAKETISSPELNTIPIIKTFFFKDC